MLNPLYIRARNGEWRQRTNGKSLFLRLPLKFGINCDLLFMSNFQISTKLHNFSEYFMSIRELKGQNGHCLLKTTLGVIFTCMCNRTLDMTQLV